VFLLKRTQNEVNLFKFIEIYIFEASNVDLLQKKILKNRLRQHNLTFTRVFSFNLQLLVNWLNLLKYTFLKVEMQKFSKKNYSKTE
jgi:hypothetical protein